MKKLLYLFSPIILMPFFAGANYYVSDYDPDYVPYNLQEVIDSMDYYSCIDDIKKFNDTYDQYLDMYGTPISVGDTLDVNYGALKEVYEEEFRQCLILVREEVKKESVENCDFGVIESLVREEERLYQDDIRSCENLRALKNCDFAYISEMEGIEKFNYREQINSCEVADESVLPEETIVKTAEQTVPVTPEIEVESISVPVSKVKKAVPANIAPELTEKLILESESKELSLPETSSSSSEIFVMTQDEIDALVAERIASELMTEELSVQQEDVTPKKKVNFVMKLWNFLFGWL